MSTGDIDVSKDRKLNNLFDEYYGYDSILMIISKRCYRVQRDITDLVKAKYHVDFNTHIYDADKKVLRMKIVGVD